MQEPISIWVVSEVSSVRLIKLFNVVFDNTEGRQVDKMTMDLTDAKRLPDRDLLPGRGIRHRGS